MVQWLRDGLEFFRAAPDIEALAATVTDTGGVYLVPAFAGLGAPHWDQYARGTIVGLTRGTTKAHIARAALEAIALQTMDVLKAMEWSLSRSAVMLGLTNRALTRFLHDDPALWTRVNDVRRELGLKPLVRDR